MRRSAAKSNATPPELSPGARARLLEYRWPGNVRELDNVLQRALIMHQGAAIEVGDLIFEDVTLARIFHKKEGKPFLIRYNSVS